MSDLTRILRKMGDNPRGVHFSELRKICEFYFGIPRQGSGSHCIFKTPWAGNPRINIQNDKGKAKSYQVKQVLKAIELIKANDDF